MKKLLAIALIAASFTACNDGDKTTETTTDSMNVTTETMETTPVTTTPDTTVIVPDTTTTITVDTANATK